MPSLRLLLLGPPRIEVDGEPVEIKRRKALALLLYLAVSGESQRRDTLATLLWPDSSQSSARAALRRDLSILNKALGGNWLTIERETIGLRTGSDLWLDTVQFQQHLADCTDMSPACLENLAKAADLYRDDFLTGFTLPDCPDFDEWQFFQAEGLRQELASGLERLVGGYRTEQNYETAIPYARRWLALDPLHEPAHRELMQLYAGNGQQAAALRQYDECTRLLHEELGASPSEETTKLYQTIKARQILPPPAAPRHNLPTQLTPLIGREEELAELARLLADPDQRLITILGLGGMGKTRLALEAATIQLDHSGPTSAGGFRHGIYVVPLASLTSADNIVGAVAQALDFSFYEAGQPQEQLLNYLQEKQLLLVMDNFEHLLDGVDLVTAILQTAPAVKIIATSRESLKLQEEQQFPLQGLAYPTGEVGAKINSDPDEGDQYAAVQLFLQHAHRIQPQLDWAAAELAAVAGICRMLEGTPLGIILAATWTKMLKPTEIGVELNQGLDFLRADLRSLPTRQQSLRAVFDHSWRLLSEEEQTVVQTLSVFRGGFTHQAVQAVTGTSLSVLMGLVDKSFLQRDRMGRYEIHELLRQYAEEKLEASGQSDEARDAHCGYYIDFLHQREAKLNRAEQQETLAEIEADGENVRIAWQWAVEQEEIERLKQALDGLCLFYNEQGRYQDGESACQLAVNKLNVTAAGTDDDQLLLAKVLKWQGTFSRRLSRIEEARQQAQQSLALLDSPALANQDTRAEKSAALAQMGLAAARGSDHQAARQAFEQSLVGYQVLDNQPALAEVLLHMGWLAWNSCEFDEARERFEASLAIYQALADQKGIANALAGLVGSLRVLGRLEESEQLLRKRLALSHASGNQAEVAHALKDLGASFFIRGKFSKAASVTGESVAIFDELGMPFWVTISGVEVSIANLHSGRYKEAQQRLLEDLILAREVGGKVQTSLALSVLGELALVEEKYVEARQLLQESVAICRAIGGRVFLACTLADLGGWAVIMGNQAEAQQYLTEGLQVATEIRSFVDQLFVLVGIALLLAERGEQARAVELYALASRYPYVANSRWFEDVFGRRIAAATVALPPEVVAAAEKRGRARDLWETAEELLVEMQGWKNTA